jgi:coatomer protein complex subunit epsilon
MVGQAVAELHLGRLPEADAALSAALQKYPDHAELIANTIILNVLTGKDTTELTSYVLLSSLHSTLVAMRL